MISLEPADPRSPQTPGAARDAATAAAFVQLFRTYASPLTRYIYSYVKSWETAEDLVQESFLQFWTRSQQAEPIRDPAGYLYVLARNQALNWRKRRVIEARYQGPSLPADVNGSAELDLLAAEAAAVVRRAVDALPERQREVLRLRCEREASYVEIAQALGITPRTVDTHLQRAIATLRKLVLRALE